jgi:hypothetical protein
MHDRLSFGMMLPRPGKSFAIQNESDFLGMQNILLRPAPATQCRVRILNQTSVGAAASKAFARFGLLPVAPDISRIGDC